MYKAEVIVPVFIAMLVANAIWPNRYLALGMLVFFGWILYVSGRAAERP